MSTQGSDGGAEKALDTHIRRAQEEEQKAAARVADIEREVKEVTDFWGTYSMISHSKKLDLKKARTALAAATAERQAAEERKRRYAAGED